MEGSVKTVSQQAFVTLRGWILDGTLAPGQIISDEEIAERLGCSRTPVREAIKTLQQFGCIETIRGRVTQVSTVDRHDLYLLDAPIAALSRLVATAAGPRLDVEEIAQMNKINSVLRDAIESSDFVGVMRANWEFHEYLANASGNRYLADALMGLFLHYQRIGGVVYFAHPVEGQYLWRDHQEIIDAYERGDIDRAVEVFTEHASTYTVPGNVILSLDELQQARR